MSLSHARRIKLSFENVIAGGRCGCVLFFVRIHDFYDGYSIAGC